jgi:hypothetical protein
VATAWELKQQQEEAKVAHLRKAGKVAGAVTQVATGLAKGTTGADIVAGLIEGATAIGLTAWQYMTGKKRAKKEARLQKAHTVVLNNITSLLSTIQVTGDQVISEHGIDPTTPEFEQILRDNLYPVMGYMGNCNINAWVPKSKPGPNRPTWFKITNNGRSFTNVSLQTVPPNLAAQWFVECRNMRDKWATTYQQLLVQQGRIQELEEFQASLKKGVNVMRVVFGLIFAVLLIMAIRYSLKIKKIQVQKGAK